MIDLGLTDEPTFRVCFMIDRYSFYFSLSGNSYLYEFFSWRKVFMFMMRNISFHKKKSTVWLRFGRKICVRDNKKRGNSAKNCPFSWFYFLQSILVLLWNWIDRNVLFYLFSASIALIFCFTSSISSLSFWMRRFISSIRLLPFFELMLRKPRLFS